jgi:ketosteroid isomerase-like protein
MNLLKIIIYSIVAFFTSMAFGQVAKSTDLYKELKKQDSILFHAAFNTCDTNTLANIFTEDFEFYHDKSGFTEGREAFLAPMRTNCAQKNPNEPQASKRILLPNTLEVYPLYNNGELYGALQHGVHRFEFLNEQKEYQKGDVAQFTHVWVKQGDAWKVKRELSFDHQYKPDFK